TIDGRTFHTPRFATDTGRAHFHVCEIPQHASENATLRLMTVRSEGQFNTVVYEEEDLYRGQERRDVILMNEQDIARLKMAPDERVTVIGPAGRMDATVRTADIRS